MTYRKILVPIEASEEGRVTLETAFALARGFGAHVDGLHVRLAAAEAVPFVGEGLSGALVQELIELTERESTARAEAAHSMFKELSRSAALPLVEVPGAQLPAARWREHSGNPADAMVSAGQLADLIVVGRDGGEGGIVRSEVFAGVLFETGRPVLVAGTAPLEAVPRRLMIGWTATGEASRAVASALPLLQRAERVSLISVRDRDRDLGEADLAAVAEYLALHGIVADQRVMPARPSVAECLASAAAECDLLVMGGYSHSRLRELILGGVTRHMLEKTTLPLLLAH